MTRIKDLPTFETLDSANWVAVDTNSEETESGKASVEVLSSYLSANLPFVQSVNQSTGISVNNSDPNNPLVGLSQSSQDALNLATTAVQPYILGGLAYQDQITVPDIDATGTPTSSSALFGDGVWRTMPGGGNMLSAIYDPQNISNDAFDLANHTGEVPPSSVTELGLTRRLSARVGGMFDTVSDLLADTTLTYSNVSSGDIIEAQGFRYEVAASGATDANIETAGGVKLYYATSLAIGTPYLQPDFVMLGTGQSNMLGGSASGGDTTVNPNVLAWNGSAWVTAEIGVAPFHNSGNNPLFHAGKAAQEARGGIVRLILSAAGGQDIDRWISTDANPSRWTDITTQVPAALAAAGLTYIDRVLWQQGEAGGTTGAITWRDKLIAVKNQMKAQTWWRDGHTRFQAGELCNDPRNSFRNNTFAIRLAGEIDPDIWVVSTEGLLGTPGDEIHFTGEGLVELGRRHGAIAMSPNAPRLDTKSMRHAPGSVYLYCELDGSGDFDNLLDLITFCSTVTFEDDERGRVTIGEGEWPVAAGGLRLFMSQGGAWEFTGVLDGSFVKPVKGDFTGTKATDLAMLRGKYLTEIACEQHGFMCGGTNGGRWNDMLFTASSPGSTQSAIRTNDSILPRNVMHGSIWLDNCAIHGWDGTSNRAILVEDMGGVEFTHGVISHCTAGALVQGKSSCIMPSVVCGYVTSLEAQATQHSFIQASGASIVKSGGGRSFQSSDMSGIDARTADNNDPSTTARDGVVWINA